MLTNLLIALAAQAAAPADYSDTANWLCLPGREDHCAANLDATVIAPDGSTNVERFQRAEAPAADCFYVYPTVSLDPTTNSDLVAGPEEERVVASQFARFGAACRTYAPMYRQITLTALREAMAGQPPRFDGALAYGDVRAAFRHYLAEHNQGRPFVLIGHSQGARMLQQLVEDEVEAGPARERLLSAMLIGFNHPVPAEGPADGLPLCRSPGQTGCIVSYVSFRDNAPPPANARFGRAEDPALRIACTNPADLSRGGPAVLDAYLGTAGAGLGARPPVPWVEGGPPIDTPFVKVPGLLTGRCVADETGSYLAVTVNADPADPRTDEIVGDVAIGNTILGDWGLHLIDVSIAQGDLIGLVRSQTEAWTKR